MTMLEERGPLVRALGRGSFPHQLSWLIDNPFRRLLISPRTFAERLPVSESSCLLEVGPGSGYFSVELARRVPGGRLELLDLQPQMLAKARRKLEAHGFRNVGYHAGDAGLGVPFPGGSIDVAVMVAVLGEVPDQTACLDGIRRALRIGGVLAIHEHIPDPDRISFPTLRSLVESQGLRFRERLGPSWNYTAFFDRPE